MNAEEFRKLGHQLVDWVADHRAGLSRLPVMSPVKPGDIRAQLPASPPEEPQPLGELPEELSRLVVPGLTQWQHPRFFAYFPSNASFSSILADLVATGLGVQGMSWQTSPAATEIEEVVMDWLRQALGLPPGFTGVLHDTASTATLVALLCAREKATGFAQAERGLQQPGPALIIYASEEAHSSIEKAVRLAGFGKAHLRLIPTGADFALRADALEAALAADRAAGLRPCAVVANIGTTATTAVDPLAEMAQLAERFGTWLHVDAAMAGSGMILPELRPLWSGIERADSMVMNPHKWLGAAFDCSAYFVRDPALLVRAMSTNPSYLHTEQDGQVKNLRDWGLPLGRRFRALKLWWLFREQGLSGLRARLRRDLANAQWLEQQVKAAPEWELLAPVLLQTVVVRHRKPGLAGAALDSHNLGVARAVNATGRAYLTPSMVRGQQAIRVSIGSEHTERPDVEAVWALLQEKARG